MSDPTPGMEGYWTAIADGSGPSVLEIIEDNLNDRDRIHGIEVVGRDGDDLIVVVARSTEHDSGRNVIDVRTMIVDLRLGDAHMTKNGIWIPRSESHASGLARSVARTSSDQTKDQGAPPVMVDGRANEKQTERGQSILGASIEQLREVDPETAEVDWSQRSVEHDQAPETVECDNCGEQVAKQDAENFGGGLTDVWVHADGCPGGDA